MVKTKKTYIEALRIIAIFLVLFQHVPAFDYYLSENHVIKEIVVLVFSLIAKVNVPLFLMISGTLLLTREERYREIFRKRMIKIILAILIFNFLVYLGENHFVFNLEEYVLGVFQNGIDRSYWYLYSYLGFLIMQPFLHRISQHLNRKDFWLILGIHFIFSTTEPIFQFFVGTVLNEDFAYTWAFRIPFSTVKEIFYPLIGFYLDRLIPAESLNAKKMAALGTATILGIAITIGFTIVSGNLYGYSDFFFEIFDYVSAIFVFLLVKFIFTRYGNRIFDSFHRFILTLGSVTYGVYLWDPFFRKLFFDSFEQFYIPYIGGFLSSVFWCICSFMGCGLLVYFLKKIPHVQKLF